MSKDRALEKFLADWAKSEQVQKKVTAVLDKELDKAVKAWGKDGALKFDKEQVLKMMSKTKFKKALDNYRKSPTK